MGALAIALGLVEQRVLLSRRIVGRAKTLGLAQPVLLLIPSELLSELVDFLASMLELIFERIERLWRCSGGDNERSRPIADRRSRVMWRRRSADAITPKMLMRPWLSHGQAL